MASTVLLLGAGRMGGALIRGWSLAGGPPPGSLMIRDPHPGPEALEAAAAGARLQPPRSALAEAEVVLLAVKPQSVPEAAAAVAGALSPEARLVSIAAGVRLRDLEAAFGLRAARVMPTTAVAVALGAASLYAEEAGARAAARALFDPVARVVELRREADIDAATAASGSAPAYFYALIEAIEAAAVAEGLEPAAASVLVRRALTGAAALLEAGGEEPAELRRQVTSKGGTTQAALDVLLGAGALPDLVRRAVRAAAARAAELAG